MKKIKLLAPFALIATFISGCGCNKVDENTYQKAVDVYKNTDAISFSRIEVITPKLGSELTRKKIDAKYVFDENKEVYSMSYSRTDYRGSSGGSSEVVQIIEYYYNKERNTLYNYSKIGESQLNRRKERVTNYSHRFNLNRCTDNDCEQMIVGNFAPIFGLNEIDTINVAENDGGAVATFKAMCLNNEACASNDQQLDYVVNIDANGNIKNISYTIENDTAIHTINYTFYGYGSNNVTITFPSDLENY